MSIANEEVTIAQLEPRMSNIDIKFKVVERGDPREVVSRRDNAVYKVSDVVVGDTTGTAVVSAWNETIEKLEPGKTYALTNAHTGLFRGHLRLKFSRDSVLEEAEEEIDEVNHEVDMSAESHSRPRRDRGYGGGRSYGGGRRRGSRDRRTSW